MRLQNIFFQRSEKWVPLFPRKKKEKKENLDSAYPASVVFVFILETDLSYLRIKYPEINSGACADDAKVAGWIPARTTHLRAGLMILLGSFLLRLF